MQFKNYVKKQIKVSTAWLLVLAFVSTSFGLYHYSPAVRALIGGRNAGGAANFGAGRSVRQPTGPTANLAAYYPLDGDAKNKVETTANNLTNVGTVTQTDTRQLAAQFTAASSESLSITDNAALSMADIDFTISGWFYFDTMTTAGLIGKWNSDTSLAEYQLYYNGNGTSKFDFFVGYGGGAVASVSSSTTPTTSTWYFVVAWHDSVANTINIQVNNGATASTAHSNGVANGTNEFRIGRDQVTNYHNGRIDSVGVWKKALSANERTYLYNSGQGRLYSEIAGYSGLSTSQVAWWELNETSGTRSDSVGSNTLTDNNTVTYATGVAGQATGNAAAFDASSSDRLTAAGTSNLEYGGKNSSFTFAAWALVNTNANTYHTILSKYAADSPATSREYYLGCSVTNCTSIGWNVYNTSNTGTNALKAFNRGVWQFVLADYNVSTGQVTLDVNNSGTPATDTLSGTLSTASSATFMLGGYGVGGNSYTWNGKLDEVATWSRLLTSSEKAALYNNGVGKTYQTVPSSLKNGLVSWWGMEEDSSSTRNDYHRSNTDTPGVVNGATLTSSGKFNQAYDFNGSSSYIAVPSMTYGPQVSFSAWIKPDTLPSISRVFSACTDPDADSVGAVCTGLDYSAITISLEGGKLSARLSESTGSGSQKRMGEDSNSTNITAGAWQHIAVTFDSTQAYANAGATVLYVNGQAVSSVTASNSDPGAATRSISYTTASYIGASRGEVLSPASVAPSFFFDGLIDDVRIYNSVLTQSDVTQLYGGSAAPNCDQSCVGWWKLDETSGSAADSGPNGFTGTITGSPTQNSQGIFNGSYKFSGNTQFISAADDAKLNLTTGSISAWIYLTSYPGTSSTIASKWVNDPYGYRFYVYTDGRVVMEIGATDGTSEYVATSLSDPVPLNTWLHVAATWSAGGGEAIYINGVKKAGPTGSKTARFGAGTFKIGRNVAEWDFLGNIDDVRVYNRALKDYEIADQYLSGRP